MLCSNRDTLEAEQRATGTIGRERIFENIFQPIEDQYDAVLIDIGPSLSLMQICAMVYTTDYVIPISMDALSVTGATAFFNTAQQLEVQIKKSCRCVGLLPTIVDHRYQNTEMVMKMIQLISENYKVPVFPGIRTDSVVAKAIRQRQFIADVDPKAKCLEDYRVGIGSAFSRLRVPGGEAYECRPTRSDASCLRKTSPQRSRKSSIARSPGRT